MHPSQSLSEPALIDADTPWGPYRDSIAPYRDIIVPCQDSILSQPFSVYIFLKIICPVIFGGCSPMS